MNNAPTAPRWKRILTWTLAVLGSLVLLDWLLDGRLRRRLPGRRTPDGAEPQA